MTQDLICLENEHLALGVAALGAELRFLRNADGQDLLWDGDPAFWTGRSPVLFPIVGRAPDDRIAIGAYEAEMPSHGFARRSVFALESVTAEACTHVLTDNPQTRAAYPFAFRLRLTHQLVADTLKVSAEVENLDAAVMPFGFGFHPAFRWPLPGGEGQPHHVTLANGAAPLMRRLDGGLLSRQSQHSPFQDGRLEIVANQFTEDAMVFPEGAGTALIYGVGGGAQLHFAFENLPNLALWNKPGAGFLCIEPWHGMAAEMGAGPEIAARPYSIALAPGRRVSFGYSVTFSI
jgi:galactose mutarotase-like enzyme